MKFSESILKKYSDKNIDIEDLSNLAMLLQHHVEDCIKGLDDKDLDYCRKGLLDINEISEKIKEILPKEIKNSIDRVSDEI